MARPRVFISSTYYDLKHIRSSLDIFVETLGFDTILSEKGNIAYAHDIPLDESCYREVENTDIFVLIIGGRYGSAASSEREERSTDFLKRYDSITKKEYEEAVRQDIPIYILIESAVFAEFETFKRNRENDSIIYAHVDSPNIFHLIEEILSKPQNNPVLQFDKFAQIETWLREQWAGRFRELLRQRSSHQQLTQLSSQIDQLREVNETLKRYLEAVLQGQTGAQSKDLVNQEENRLRAARERAVLEDNQLFRYLINRNKADKHHVSELFFKAVTPDDFINGVADAVEDTEDRQRVSNMLKKSRAVMIRDVNSARETLGYSPLEFDGGDETEGGESPKSRQRSRKSRPKSPAKQKQSED